MQVIYPVIFTLFQITWAFLWAAKHFQIRRQREYANNRTQKDTNTRYRIVSHFLYLAQNLICVFSFWSNSAFLFKVHSSNLVRLAGAILIIIATILYWR